MTTFRSIISSLLAFSMLLSAVPASAGTYDSTDAIAYVRNHGYMTGYASGSFGENNAVNRAEFAKVITLIYSSNVSPRYTITLPFRDTANNAWYTPYIVYVYGNGLMTGYTDNTFHPDSTISFAEAAKVLSMVYNLRTSGSTDKWYEAPVRALDDENAIPLSISGINQTLTRAQLADIVYRLDSRTTNLSSRTYDDLVNDNRTSSHFDRDRPYDNRYRNAYCTGNRNLDVTITPTTATVRPGDSLTYNITIKNCSGHDQNIDASATLDSQTTYVSSSDRGRENNNRRVTWDNIWVNDGDSHTLSLRVTVQSYAGSNDRIDLSVRIDDEDGDTDSDTDTITLSRITGRNCYYDSRNRYVCTTRTTHCYYDSHNHYICDDDSNRNCYYDLNNRYMCDDNDYNYDTYYNSQNCYYDNRGNYICHNNSNSNCYYDSRNNYICNNSTNNNCYYDSYGTYRCSNNSNNNCYYDSNNNYVCNNNSSNNNCYYNSNGNYVCSNNNNNSSNCYLDSSNIYHCN